MIQTVLDEEKRGTRRKEWRGEWNNEKVAKKWKMKKSLKDASLASLGLVLLSLVFRLHMSFHLLHPPQPLRKPARKKTCFRRNHYPIVKQKSLDALIIDICSDSWDWKKTTQSATKKLYLFYPLSFFFHLFFFLPSSLSFFLFFPFLKFSNL